LRAQYLGVTEINKDLFLFEGEIIKKINKKRRIKGETTEK
jgi:hypothetical protein